MMTQLHYAGDLHNFGFMRISSAPSKNVLVFYNDWMKDGDVPRAKVLGFVEYPNGCPVICPLCEEEYASAEAQLRQNGYEVSIA